MKKKEEMRSRRRQRKEQEEKWEETRPRESKLPGVLEPPLSVLSRRRLFIHLVCPFSLFLDKEKKQTTNEKSSHPSTHYHR